MKHLLVILWLVLFSQEFLFSQAIHKSGDTTALHKLKVGRKLFYDNIPRHVKWTNDFEKLYTDKQKHQLDSAITAFDNKTTIEISIITLDTLCTSKANFDSTILHVAQVWAERSRDKSNGVLIGISKSCKKIRIQNSVGVEMIINNDETKKIIDSNFIPYFRKGDYFGGTMSGLLQIMQVINEKLK